MNGMDKATYTVVTCHFGDRFWIQHMLSQIQINSGPEISEIIVVDQSRDSYVFLRNLAGVTEVLEFPVDETQAAILGHCNLAAVSA